MCFLHMATVILSHVNDIGSRQKSLLSMMFV